MEELNGAPPTRQRAGLITIKARNVARQNSDSILKLTGRNCVSRPAFPASM